MVPELLQMNAQEQQDILNHMFSRESFLLAWDQPFESESPGMCGVVWDEALPYVNAFRQLLSDWPGAPSTLSMAIAPQPTGYFASESVSLATRLFSRTKEAMTFYIHIFFANVGRPPVLPCLFPDH